MGAILSFILLAWTAGAWFSGPYDQPFLGLPLFRVPPLIPFTAFLLWSLVVFYLWLRRRGKTAGEKLSQYLHRERKTVVILGGILVFHLVVISGPAVLNYWGENDSDSGLHGLAGYHIAAGTERPMYVYGSHYVGSLKAHIAALFNWRFGKNPMYQRAIGAVFFLGFLVGLFIFVRRLFDEKTALLAAALAAIPPFAAAAQLRYDEFTELPFWGIIGFNLLLSLYREHSHQDTKTRRKEEIIRFSHEDTRRDTKENIPGAQISAPLRVGVPPPGPKGLLRVPAPRGKYYFWYGVVLGIQFFAHPQAIYFMITGFLVLLAVDKWFFLRWRYWLIPLGIIIGTTPTWVDSYFHDWVIFRAFFGKEIKYAGHLLERLMYTLTNLYRNLTEFWGLGPIYPFPFTVPRILITAVMAAAAAGFIYYLFISRREIKTFFTWKRGTVSRLIPLVFTVVVLVIFCLSAKTSLFGPFRYVYVLGMVIPVVIAAGATIPTSRWGKGLGIGFLVVSAALFSLSHFYYMKASWEAGQKSQRFINFCRQENITHYYGDFWLVYQCNFTSKEEIIGSACFPENNDPYMKYREKVDYSAKPPAYVFSPVPWRDSFSKAVWFKKALINLGIRCTQEQIGPHLVYYNLSEHLTPAQLSNLTLRNKVTVEGFSLREITGGKGGEDLHLVTFHCRNVGKSILCIDGNSAMAELVINAADGTLLRRQPLDKNIPPGEPFKCQVLMGLQEMKGQPVYVHIKLNDIIATANKQPFIFQPSDLEVVKPANQAIETKETIETKRAKGINVSLLQGRLRPGQLPEFMLVNGWGKRLRPSGQLVQWSGGKQSEIAFLVNDPSKEIRVKLLLEPYKDKKFKDRQQSVQFYCNDREIKGVYSLMELSSIRLKLTPGMLHPGINRLRIKPLLVEPEYRNMRMNPGFNYRPRAFALRSMNFIQAR